MSHVVSILLGRPTVYTTVHLRNINDLAAPLISSKRDGFLQATYTFTSGLSVTE